MTSSMDQPKKKVLRVGIDIDETITAEPELFACLSQALVKAGHQVHILTFRGPHLKDETEKFLKELGIEYPGLHMGEHYVDLELKASWAKQLNLDVVFEDRVEVLDNLPETVRKILIFPK